MMQLHYKVFGRGFPIIIIHGLFGSSDNWQTISKRLAQYHTVFIIDLPNHGQSPHTEQIDYPFMAEQLFRFMETHCIATAHIIGHSMGGKVAMCFAQLYTDMVEKLIIVDVAPVAYKPSHVEIFEALRTADLKTEQRKNIEMYLATRIVNPNVRQFLMKGLKRNKEGGFSWKFNVRVLWENYHILIGTPDISTPVYKKTLFLKGAESDYVTDTYTKEMERLFPLYSIQTIPNAGHWVHAQQPEKFLHAVFQFLEVVNDKLLKF